MSTENNNIETPSTETPQTPAAPAEDLFEKVSKLEEPNYEELVQEGDVEVESVETPAPAAQPSPPESPPATPSASAQPPVAPGPTEQPKPSGAAEPIAPAPAVPPAAAQPAAPEVPGLASATAEQVQAMLKAVDDALLQKYSFSPEEAAEVDKLEARPSEYLPRVMSKLHRDVYVSALDSAMRQIPDLVRNVTARQLVEDRNEQEFFTAFPDLKGQDETVVKAIQAIRTVSPDEPTKSLIQKAGMLAMISLGKTPGAAQPPVQQSTNVTPFRPAAPGSAGASPSSRLTPEEAIFASMAEEALRNI